MYISKGRPLICSYPTNIYIYLFQENRCRVIHDMCRRSQLERQNIDYEKFANLTEGYTIGFLNQFLDRAIFYAHRNNNNCPVITNQVLVESLKTTNAYCLQDIHNNFNEPSQADTIIDLLPGLEYPLSVFEEVLRWPHTHPHIFNQSPLRNQAGILLFGAPGTGQFMNFQLSFNFSIAYT